MSPRPPISRRALLRHAPFALAAPLAVGAAPPRGAPRDVVDAYFLAAQREDVAAVVAFFAPDAEYEDVTFAFRIRGHEALRRMFEGAFVGMRGAEREARRVVAEGARVVVEWVATGAHTGDVLGVPATGRRLTVRAVSIIEVAEGRIVRVSDYTDRAGLEAQLRGGG